MMIISKEGQSMDWGKSFTYLFDDKDWVAKVLIGGILSLIPVVNLVVIGYVLKALKNVAEGVEPPLPAWDDFGDYLVKGLVSVLAAMVWALPIIILATMSAVLSALTGYGSADTTNVSTPFVLCMWSMSCVSGIYALFLGFVLPAAFAQYAVRGDFGAFFRFGDIYKFIKVNLGNYIVAIILAAVAQFLSGFGVILCCVGAIFTQFWALLVGSHLLGQVYRGSEAASPPTVAAEPTA
jgi:hypothetical protein